MEVVDPENLPSIVENNEPGATLDGESDKKTSCSNQENPSKLVEVCTES